MNGGSAFRQLATILMLVMVALCGQTGFAFQDDPRPNIILINLDDADWSLFEDDFKPGAGFRYFPNIARLADEGMRFTNFHVTTPICGPSRACLLSGQYAHRVGIQCNDPADKSSRGLSGGYDVWRQTGLAGQSGPTYANSNLAVWLNQSGYHTMVVGKYLHNGFGPGPGEDWRDLIPPGWDESYITLGASYYNSNQVVNGVLRQFGQLNRTDYPSNYRTDIEAADVKRLVRAHHAGNPNQPFFMYFAPLTPHREDSSSQDLEEVLPDRGMVPQRYRHWWPNLFQQIGPDFNEWDMSDKPGQLSALEPLRLTGATWRENDLVFADLEFRRRALSIRAIDDFVRDLRAMLEELDLDQNTIVMLTSDNGYLLGQQRMFSKGVCLDRCTRVPLIVWAPGLVPHRPEGLKYLLAHVDLAPTILDLAGVTAPVAFAGKSFRSLLENTYGGLFRDWRPEGVLLEHWQDKYEGNNVIHSTLCGIRLFDSVFLEWATGETEYYDLRDDPLQLNNRTNEISESQRIYFRNLVRYHKQDIAFPVSHIASPFGPLGVTYLEQEISGIAEYRSGIREVRIVIRDVTDGTPKFWNGQNFQAGYTTVQADLEGQNLTLVNWTYRFSPPVSQSTRNYAVASRTYGEDGSYQPVPDSTLLWIESAQPFGLIDSPTYNSQTRKYFGHPVRVTGWASDSDGMRLVRLVLRETTTGLFWNGSGWQLSPTTLPVNMTLGFSGKHIYWDYDFEPPQNSGTVKATLRMLSTDLDKPVRTVTSRFSWTD